MVLFEVTTGGLLSLLYMYMMVSYIFVFVVSTLALSSHLAADKDIGIDDAIFYVSINAFAFITIYMVICAGFDWISDMFNEYLREG